MKVLGIETSCDETSAAVYDGSVLSNVVYTQISHREYGGVVPEIASRDHLKKIESVVSESLRLTNIGIQEIDGIAATYGPGLIGAILVGLTFAKSLAWAISKPFFAVNHIEGHIFSAFIEKKSFSSPILCLLASGGHTEIILIEELGKYEVLGETVDDAAGEALDKISKLIGLGYPGGPAIEKSALTGDNKKFLFPRPDPGGLNFSFSGLKTAVLYMYQALNNKEKISLMNDIAASFQEAVIDSLTNKLIKASKSTGIKRIAVCGGVSANRRLRKKIQEKFDGAIFPLPEYATDNGAMIASAGYFHLKRGESSPFSIRGNSNLSLT